MKLQIQKKANKIQLKKATISPMEGMNEEELIDYDPKKYSNRDLMRHLVVCAYWSAEAHKPEHEIMENILPQIEAEVFVRMGG